MRDAHIEKAYDEITDHLNKAPDTRHWELAVKRRVVSEYIKGENSIEDLAEGLEDISDFLSKLEEVRTEAQQSEPTQSAPNYRRWAVNEIFALEAANMDFVQGFRTTWLADGLLNMNDVDAWIMERKVIEGSPPTGTATVAGQSDRSRIEGHAPLERSPGQVKFVVPDSTWIRSEIVDAGGALSHLETVAQMLARRYDWPEAWAATFVLTGTVPPAIAAHWTSHEPWPWFKARRSLTITVRLDMQPKQLMELYRERRNQMLLDEPLPRAIGERKAKLAVFAARHRVGHTWGKTMRRWNQKYPDFRVESEAMFSRDSHDAFLRIMGEPLDWIGTAPAREADRGPN